MTMLEREMHFSKYVITAMSECAVNNVTCFQVNQWLTWLAEAEYEEEEDEDGDE